MEQLGGAFGVMSRIGAAFKKKVEQEQAKMGLGNNTAMERRSTMRVIPEDNFENRAESAVQQLERKKTGLNIKLVSMKDSQHDPET